MKRRLNFTSHAYAFSSWRPSCCRQLSTATSHSKAAPTSTIVEPVRTFSDAFSRRVFLCHPHLNAATAQHIRSLWPSNRLSSLSRRVFDSDPPLSFDRFKALFFTPKSETEAAEDDALHREYESSMASGERSFVSVRTSDYIPCAVNVPLRWVALTNNPRGYQPLRMDPPTATLTSNVSANASLAMELREIHQLYALLPRSWFADDPVINATPTTATTTATTATTTPTLGYPLRSSLSVSPSTFIDLSAGAQMRLIDYWIVSLLRETTSAFRLLSPLRSVTPLPPSDTDTGGGMSLAYTFPVSVGYGVRTLTPYEWFVSQPWRRGTPIHPPSSSASSSSSSSYAVGYWRNPCYQSLSSCYIVDIAGAYLNVRDEHFTAAQHTNGAAIVIPGKWTEPPPLKGHAH